MNEQKHRFVRALASFLAGGAAMKSIALQMGKQWAQEWAALRQETPLSGWCTIEEAEQQLAQFLGEDSTTERLREERDKGGEEACPLCGGTHKPGTAGHIRCGLRHDPPGREVLAVLRATDEAYGDDDGGEG